MTRMLRSYYLHCALLARSLPRAYNYLFLNDTISSSCPAPISDQLNCWHLRVVLLFNKYFGHQVPMRHSIAKSLDLSDKVYPAVHFLKLDHAQPHDRRRVFTKQLAEYVSNLSPIFGWEIEQVLHDLPLSTGLPQDYIPLLTKSNDYHQTKTKRIFP